MSVESALVLFSGGQDSTTCLAWALDRFPRVETVGFAYGQRHAVELEARKTILARFPELFPAWAERLGPDHLLSLDVLSEIGGSALTDDMAIAIGSKGLPTTFVPGRNLMFLTAAAGLGARRDIRNLVGGMCQTDYSGYPDCRRETIDAFEKAIHLGFGDPYEVRTPLMWLDKAATWALAQRLGGARLVELIIEETATCYRGNRESRHEWGYGCADCPACDLRAEGYRRYRERERAQDLTQ